jgi:FlaA1/EpsC-like NDP-sugar epimerase
MGLLSRHRLGHVALDAGLLVIAWFGAFFLRSVETNVDFWSHYRDVGVVRVVVAKSLVLVALGIYTRLWRYTSLNDVVALARAVVVAEVAAYLVLWLLPPVAMQGHSMSRGIIALDLALTGLLLVSARAIARIAFERPRSGGPFAKGREVLVIGAGNAGDLILSEMSKGRSGFTPIGVLDDDPRKRGVRLHGVKVLGPIDELESRLLQSPPDEVVIAMNSASGDRRRYVVEACRRLGVPVRTLPGPDELLDGDGGVVGQLREVRVEDVLGRPPVRLELGSIAGYLQDRTVLVTGAGGSIGSELVRQLARVSPGRLVLVDNAETNLFHIDRELADHGVGDVVALLADIKEPARMRSILAEHRPSVIFHAAAYKHVPMTEMNPAEAIRNNTLATRDLAVLAREHGVERFVLISTDKAVNPQTVLGASKALCEWVVEAAAQQESETRFIAVRFGNVLASSGSVIPIFRDQIAAGGPVTVTDERMTRFFMTIPEAAQLVLEAGGVGESGEIFVLDMGEPVSIMTLAESMIRLSGKEPGVDIDIRVIGVRAGEKIHEVLFEPDETVERTRHEKLQVARRAPIDAAWLADRLAAIEALVADGAAAHARDLMYETVRTPVRMGEARDRERAGA